jgi:tetratricopeptide (TPR) repeat protein
VKWLLALAVAMVCDGQDTAAAHLGRGYDLIQQQRYEQAASEFRRALEIDPSLLRARYQLGIALFATADREEAARQFEVVRRGAPDNRGALYYLGRLRLLEGDNDGAARLLAPLADNPPLPDTLFYLGCALLGKGDAQGAIGALQRAESDAPRDYRIPYRLARAYSLAGRGQDAATEYQKAAALRGEYNRAAAEALQCVTALDNGSSETPCRALLDPNDPDKLTTLGMIYGEHGLYDKAIQPLEAASKLDPDSFEIFHNLGLSYFRLHQFDKARPALERAVSLRPEFFGSNALLGAALFSLKDDAAAYRVLRHARELDPANAEVADLLFKTSLVLARDRFEAKDYARCIEYLRQAADVNPSDAPVHRRLAQVYGIAGHADLSRREAEIADRIEAAGR